MVTRGAVAREAARVVRVAVAGAPGGGGVRRRLTDALRGAVRSGRLPPGTLLPPCRGDALCRALPWPPGSG